MDKTGTLTKGVFGVDSIHCIAQDISKDQLLKIAATAESYSSHPIATSLVNEYLSRTGQNAEELKSHIDNISELAGHGIEAVIDGIGYYIGNDDLMSDKGIVVNNLPDDATSVEVGTIVYIADHNRILGCILLSDIVKEDAADAIKGIKAAGVKRIVMLTGDRKATAEAVAARIGINEYHSDLLPADKVDIVEQLIADRSADGKLIFVGDGINDAPVLARADIGIAMGGLGSDAAIEAADIVIMTDEPAKIAKAIQISRRTLRIVKENIVFAIGVKLLILLLAAIGFASMWAAVFADVGVAFIAILNAMRALKTD